MKKYSDEEFLEELQKFYNETIGVLSSISKITDPPDGKDYMLNLALNKFYLRRLEMRFIKKLYHPELNEQYINILCNILSFSKSCLSSETKALLKAAKSLQDMQLNESQSYKFEDIETYAIEVFTIAREMVENPYYIKLRTKENSNE